ncbi:hypothetical protein [Desulfotruncus alcoholivorax]|uniref:hypothetical protein n=1 Tax=Desulfotruncus alcoholivorax TaxID=265477 RepID=UPI0003F629B3|nr:hypothetical protein [Desulfotruncus alcoholivorax]
MANKKAVQIVENQEHISIMCGDKNISDMLVFLAYRKLKHVLNNQALRSSQIKGK